jgi:hypothetical protein
VANAEPAEQTDVPSPLESVGLACARAAAVACVVGVGEGLVVARAAETSAEGIGLATAGLWFPIALVGLVPGLFFRRLESATARRALSFGLFAAFLAAVLFARFSSFAPPLARALPAELLASVGLGWAAMELRFEAPLRRPVAIAGLVAAAVLQVYASRWVDAHRAFASLLTQHTAVPRLMLKFVLRRFV